MTSETRYASVDGMNVAYQVIGDGPIDVALNFGFFSHVEHIFNEPHIAALVERVASFARIIVFDRRGIGLSDSDGRAPTLEQQADDLIAVLDDIGSESAAIYGFTAGAPFALMLAAMEPDRVSHLILSSGFAKMTAGDGYPHGNTPEVRDGLRKLIETRWGTGEQAALSVPSLVGDPQFREWIASLERLSAPPSGMLRFMDLVGEIDVRPLLPSITQPTLVLHPSASITFDAGHSRYLAEHIPNARYVDVPGPDIFPVTPESLNVVASEIEELLTGERTIRSHARTLSTLLFTDIVGSTSRAAEIGDSNWHTLLDRHDAAIRTELDRFRGREVNTTGDGFLASFDGPERAIRCALAATESVSHTGLQIRAGVHTGECEVRGNDLGGIAVHIGARVAAKADPDEVLVSRTVRDLVAGSDLSFEDRGTHELKGVPGEWPLYKASTA